MTGEAERLHSPSQVGAELGLKTGMVRRYHLAYEAVTGEPLPRDPVNNGRLATDRQLAVLVQARDAVRRTPTLSAEDAIRHVLGFATIPTVPAAPQTDLLEAILHELQAARERDAARERQMQAILESNERLTEQLRALTPPSSSDEAPPKGETDREAAPASEQPFSGTADGALVRVARWVEGRLFRGRG